MSIKSQRISLIIVFFLALCTPFGSHAAQKDTLRLTIRQADSVFFKNALIPLANRYRVQAMDAYAVQAKIWENPELYVEIPAYNPEKNIWLDAGRGGQHVISVSQLIQTGGKRSRNIALAQTRASLSKLEFEDLLRSLLFEIHSRLIDNYFDKMVIDKYAAQIDLMQSIIDAYQFQFEKGNIPLKDVLRLKAALLELNNLRVSLLTEWQDQQAELKTMLGIDQDVLPIIQPIKQDNSALSNITLPTLLDKAFSLRKDWLAENKDLELAEINKKLQKSLAVPDARLGAIYDRQANYVPGYTGLTLSFALPTWNRNQWNIAAADYELKAKKVEVSAKQLQITNEVEAAYRNALLLETEWNKTRLQLTADMEQLNTGVVENFRKRNISMLEFIDFFEAYNASIMQTNDLRSKRILAFERLNYVTGAQIVNF